MTKTAFFPSLVGLRRRPSSETLSTSRSPALTLRDLALRRLTTDRQTIFAGLPINRHLRRISGRIENSMSDSEVKSQKMEGGEQRAPVPSEKKTQKLPPPPEQPEPGDCCGSGCVRCVWDVYYDELEEYNKLLKEISRSPADSTASPSND